MREAEIISFSTMATDGMMLGLAKTRALEEQCYVVMSSFIRRYVGMCFTGNVAIIEPSFLTTRNMRMVAQPKVLRHLTEEGIIEAELDTAYIRRVKREYPMEHL